MAKNKNALKLNGLRSEIHASIKAFAEKLIVALGDNLQSITVVGSGLTEDFRPPSAAVTLLRRRGVHSDINTVIVLERLTITALNTIASLARPMRNKCISPPLLMTPSYIEQSRDVFGVEFLDFQLTHRTILGDDPFAALTFDKKDVRLQCERELKAMLIRLRQGYIAAAANKKLVRDILVSTAKGLTPLLRAMLWLKDIARPARTETTFNKAAGEFSINTDSLKTAGRWRYEKLRLGETDIESAFESVYTTVEQLALTVDKLEV